MKDREKLQIIQQWVNEAIIQGNKTVLVMAIKSILDEPNETIIEKRGVVKLSQKSLEILREKRK